MRNLTVLVHPHFCVILALSLFILPVPFVFGWIVAAGIHELCHFIMIRIMGLKVYSVSIGATGAVIKTEPMSPAQELFCSLAGPVGGLIPICFTRYLPYVALSAAIQSCYNLLPVYPLDGGRALNSVITHFAGEAIGFRVSRFVSVIVIVLVTLGAGWLSCRYRLGLSLIVFPAILLISNVWKNSLQRREKNCRI